MARTRLGDLELTLRTFSSVKLYQELQFTPHLGTQNFHGMVMNTRSYYDKSMKE